jgi:hypothetical protein
MSMKNLCLLALCGFVVGALGARVHSAHAIEAFKKEFEAKYVKKDGSSDAEKSFAAAVEKAKCNVCHVGKTKKVRNDYGKALGALVTKKDGKDSAKIQEAFDKVAAEKSKPGDANSPTFGDLIKEGKLPGGEPAGN